MMWLRCLCAVAVVATATVSRPDRTRADDYPSKPIRLIVVTAAGGLMDVAARVTRRESRTSRSASVW